MCGPRVFQLGIPPLSPTGAARIKPGALPVSLRGSGGSGRVMARPPSAAVTSLPESPALLSLPSPRGSERLWELFLKAGLAERSEMRKEGDPAAPGLLRRCQRCHLACPSFPAAPSPRWHLQKFSPHSTLPLLLLCSPSRLGDSCLETDPGSLSF